MEEKKIPYEYKEVNPYHKEPAFLKINPKGLVPAIERNGKALAESNILIEFLEDAYPDTISLFSTTSSSAEEKALTRMLIDMVGKKIVAPFFQVLQTQDKKGQQAARMELANGLKEFASKIPTGQTFHGGQDVDAADITLAPWTAREYILEESRGGPFTEEEVGAKYLTWKKAILNRPSVINTLSDREKYAPIYGRYLRDEAQSDAAKATRAGRAIP